MIKLTPCHLRKRDLFQQDKLSKLKQIPAKVLDEHDIKKVYIVNLSNNFFLKLIENNVEDVVTGLVIFQIIKHA